MTANSTVTNTGNWDGRRSDEVLVEDENGKRCLARLYQGIMDGNKFADWYDERDFDLKDKIIRWMKIPD